MNTAATTASTSRRSEPSAGKSFYAALAVALIWGGLITTVLSPETEPITGSARTTLVWVFGLNMVSGYGAAWACLRRDFAAGFVLVPLALLVLFLSVPAFSKPGATLTVSNQTPTRTQLQISRTDRPGRSVTLSVEPGSQVTHRTAPGDYSESVEVQFVAGERRLTATIGQLRTNQVAVTKAGLALVELQRGPP